MSSSPEKINSKMSKRAQEKTAALLRRTYTTRQIMELMELRRRQKSSPEDEHPELPDAVQSPAPSEETVVTRPSASTEIEPQPRWENRSGDDQAAAGQPNNELPSPEEQSFAGPAEPLETLNIPENESENHHQNLNTAIESFQKPRKEKSRAHLRSFLSYLGTALAGGVLTAGAFILFVVMLTHVLSQADAADYPQGQFIFLAVLSTAWLSRRRLQRGERSLWRGALTLIAGLVIFAYAAIQGLVYLEIMGVVLTSFGIFCAHYTREAANRLALPLLCLMFVVAPPASLSAMVAPHLNMWIAQASVALLRFLHIPVAFSDGEWLNAGGYEFSLNRDLTAFHALISTLPLAVFWAHLHARKTYRQGIVLAAAFPLVLLSGIIHMTGTGWVAYTYGNPYADGFYNMAGVIVFCVLGFFVLADGLISDEEHL